MSIPRSVQYLGWLLLSFCASTLPATWFPDASTSGLTAGLGPRSAAAGLDWDWLTGAPRITPSPARLTSTRLEACAPSVFGAPPHGPGSTPWEQSLTPLKEAWNTAHGGLDTARPFLRDRLREWPQQLLVDRATMPAGDRDFLVRLARDTWRGLDAFTDRENGLPIDHVAFGPTGTAVETAWIGDYTSPTNIGLYVMAVIGAADLGFVTRLEALERLQRVFATLDRLPTHEGFFFNFYDTTSLERTSNFVSFVDSTWLTAGLIVARNAFPEIADHASRLIAASNYGFLYDEDTQLVSHGYSLTTGGRAGFHYGVLYTEARLGVSIAIGKGDVPAASWYRMLRTFPTSCGWQTLQPQDVHTVEHDGVPVVAGAYIWGGYRYVPSWGGSMFEALMPVLVLDELRYARRSLGVNGVIHALVQQQYAQDQLGYPVWGLSPSAAVDGTGYGEFGARILGSRGYDPGPVSPHAAALALAVVPEAAVANLRTMTERFDAYGEYGFYDAIDPRRGTVAYKYLTLDQAMLFLSLVNHLGEQAIQRYFAADRIVQNVIPMLAAEDFFPDRDPLPIMCAAAGTDGTVAPEEPGSSGARVR
ncbi:hypothetical protein L6Q96_20430 [Candidatus Binatia bacterium]|nr:hypothetical protein [Candidatus Binatia bacterium]